MLNSLRQGAKTWIAKLFIIILAASFGVIFMVADYFTGYGGNSVATVGDIDITTDAHSRLMQRQITGLSQALRRHITRQQAQSFGITPRSTLDLLITNAAIETHADQLGLGYSQKALEEEIFTNPVFQGDDGEFSPIRFNEVLRNNNFSEQSFMSEQRREVVRNQLIATFTSDLHQPEALLDNRNLFDNNTRTVNYFTLPMSRAGKIAAPDEKTQNTFLEGNKQLFTAPEYRGLGVLTLSPDIVRKTLEITKQDVETHYNENIDRYSVPGKRHIRRISFIDREKAGEAKADLDKGMDFMKVAKKFGFKTEGTDLGFIDKTELADKRIAEIAFSLKEGKISEPIVAGLGTALIQVVKINKASIQKKLVDVEDEIRKDLERVRSIDRVGELQETIEDERAAGKSLADIAKALDLPFATTNAIDRTGKGMDGKPVTTLKVTPQLLTSAFESDVGVENEPLELGGGAINWFEVLKLTPKRLKKLEEVKGELVKIWTQREREKKMTKLASATVAAIREGSSLAEQAKKYKAEVKASKPFTRAQEHDDLPASAVSQAFVLPINGTGLSSLPGDKGRVIFTVTKKETAKPLDDAKKKQLTSGLDRQLQNDIYNQYVNAVRKRVGFKIHKSVLKRISGAGR